MFPVFSNPLMFIQLGPVSSFQNLIRSKIQPPRSQRVLVSTSSFPPPGAIPDDPRADEESEFFGTLRKRKKKQQPTQRRKAARKPKTPANDPKPVVVVNLETDDEGNNSASAGSQSSEVEQAHVATQKTLGSVRTSSDIHGVVCVCVHTPFSVQGSFDWLS